MGIYFVGLPELLEDMTEGGAGSKTKGAVEGVKEKLGVGESGDEEREKTRTQAASRGRGLSDVHAPGLVSACGRGDARPDRLVRGLPLGHR